MAALDEPKSTTFDSGEPYLGLILSNRRVREDRLVALVIPQAGNLRFSPPSSYTTQDLFFLLSLLRDEAYCTFLPTPGCFAQFLDLFRFYRQYPPGALTLTSYAITTDGSGSGPGVPCSAYPYVRCTALSQLVPSPGHFLRLRMAVVVGASFALYSPLCISSSVGLLESVMQVEISGSVCLARAMEGLALAYLASD
ncbi:hypothetical protein PIB30_091802 [Stylosanthes scabra]|uniref:Uncharacterized protein n=1 Tax=Stylosanthes scabra TaxID=79078 RepID=A0ABU6YTH5_9FABA|nr:hypothetical protein [Stylosanthes scabra]